MFFYLNSDVFSLYFKRCANWHQLTHLSNKTRHSYINLLCIAGQTAGPNRLKFVVDTLRSDQGGGGLIANKNRNFVSTFFSIFSPRATLGSSACNT